MAFDRGVELVHGAGIYIVPRFLRSLGQSIHVKGVLNHKSFKSLLRQNNLLCHNNKVCVSPPISIPSIIDYG